MHNSCHPRFLQIYIYIYIYPLINILYLGEPSGNFNLKLPWHIYTHIHACISSYMYPKYLTVFFPVNVAVLFTSVTYFLLMLLLKLFHFLPVVNSSQFDMINFPSCHIPQVNRCQNIIICLITKIHVQK